MSPQLPRPHPHRGHSPPPSPQTRARRSRHTWGSPGGGSERRRGRERPGSRGKDCGPRPGDATEPRSPAGGGRERESAKEGASREDQLLGAQITAPPTPPSQTQPVPPRARLRNLAPAPTTIVPAHLTPSPGEGGGGGHRGARARPGEGNEPVLGGRWVPEHLRGRGGGEEGEERLRAGRIQAGRRRGEERCGDRDARQPRNYSAGKQRAAAGEGGGAETARETRPGRRLERAQVSRKPERERQREDGEDRKMGRPWETEEARERAADGGGVPGDCRAGLGPCVPEAPKANPAVVPGRNGLGAPRLMTGRQLLPQQVPGPLSTGTLRQRRCCPTLEKGGTFRELGRPPHTCCTDRFCLSPARMGVPFPTSLPRIVPDSAKASVGTGAERGCFR